MSSFTEPLILKYLPQSNLWRTEREFSYSVGKEFSGDKITVPRYFLTDLASVPWPASMLIPKSGQFNQSAILHDFLYHIRGKISEPYNLKERSRSEVDQILLEAMGVLGVNWFKRQLMYRAVRIGGGISWSKPVKPNGGKTMKKLMSIVLIAMLCLIPVQVFAHSAYAEQPEAVHNTLNGAFDAPHLIGLKQIHPDLWIGVEGTKGVATNLSYDSFEGIEDDYNYQIFAKLTFDGCLINCPEK